MRFKDLVLKVQDKKVINIIEHDFNNYKNNKIHEVITKEYEESEVYFFNLDLKDKVIDVIKRLKYNNISYKENKSNLQVSVFKGNRFFNNPNKEKLIFDSAVQFEINNKEWYIDYNDFIKINDIKFNICNKVYWKNVYRKLEDSYIICAGETYNILRYNRRIFINDKLEWLKQKRYSVRYQELTKWRELTPIGLYGQTVGKWLNNEINKMISDINDGCIDNLRFANLKVNREKKWYKMCRDKGCCGFYDNKVKHPLYGEFIIGCNYGH